ncbi:MAG: hypothetical protein Kow0059_07120 [Candidatus Sumerlaeia bacterium]
MSELTKHIKDVLKKSTFLASVKAANNTKARSALFGAKVRNLTREEIAALEAQGNWAEDWSKVLVHKDFTVVPGHISKNCFLGRVVIGCQTGQDVVVEKGVPFATGIWESTIINSEIGNECVIYRADTISNYVINCHSVVYQTKSLVCTGETTFGNGRDLSIAIETGGREVATYAELTIPVAELVAGRRGDAALQKEYKEFIAKYKQAATSKVGVVESGAVIRNTSKVVDTFVGSGAVIDGATLVKNTTILSTPEEKTEICDGAYVKNSILQWGCEAVSMAIVAESVLTEHSHVERHGKVTESIVGPNSGVAEGEVTASLLGPFVGFHHQSLLIAAFWPEGKGNVGYGANVGSNHTSKAPDQEIWCGEGTFFGLGVNIKFPSDFTDAPYSIIASGVNALPQRVEMPFSLINTAAHRIEGVSPAYNEIMPGWVLSDNIYTVRRNEGKYKKRNKARRSVFVFDVFRPDIVDKMIEARNRLRAVAEIKKVYTDKDIKGLGKNYMFEASRLAGIDAYNFYIEYYALKGLKDVVTALVAEKQVRQATEVYSYKGGGAAWKHVRSVLKAEGFDKRSVSDNLKRLSEMAEKIARDTQESKEKDDVRGARIIKDYPTAHPPAADDGFVKQTWAETKELQKEIAELVKKIG